MKPQDLTRPLTASSLNENMYKQFNVKIDFDRYSREQLENYRNLLRTKVHALETQTNFNDLLTNETYQRDKFMLGVLNTRIKEMLGEARLAEKKLTAAEKTKREKVVKSMKKSKGEFEKEYPGRGKDVMYATATKIAKKTAEGTTTEASEDTATCCCKTKGKTKCPVHGNVKEAMKMKKGPDGKMVPAFAADGKGKHDLTKKKVAESVAYYLAEDEEGKAKAITAAADMVNDFTSWMQRVGNYQTKSMIELADNIRANFSMQDAETFKQSVGSALESALDALTTAREQINQAVSVLAGEAPPSQPMGADMGSAADDEMMPQTDGMNMPPEDEFAASDAAAGGSETTGRLKRESIERGNRLMRILGS